MGRERQGFLIRMVSLCAIGAGALVAGCESSDDDLSTSGTGSTGSGMGGAGGTGVTTTTGSMTTSASGTTVASSSSGMPPECVMASDCDAALGGPPACGAWACNGGNCEASSPGCTDADHDGFGAGVNCACAGIDCDDADDTISDQAVASCYSGPAGTSNVGSCAAGSQTCTAGIWSACVGEVLPSGEACNGLDEDCNGTPDNGTGMITCGLGACKTTIPACAMGQPGVCLPPSPPPPITDATCDGIDDDCDGVVDEDCKSCIPVTTTGNDGTADGTTTKPFQTVQAAINWAATHVGPKLVCVAAGSACGTPNVPVTGVYANAAGTTVTMSNGVSVAGNYESTTWNQCPIATTTILQPKTPEGVTFPNTVVLPTSLSDVRVDRFAVGGVGATAGVTVNGAKNVVLTRVTIANSVTAASSYGVNVLNAGSALVTRSRIDGGSGSAEAIGVRSIGSQVSLVNNCLSLDATGHCDDGCGGNPPNPAIRGNPGGGNVTASYGVFLSDSPGSLIEGSAVCGGTATDGAAIRVSGDATGDIIRTSNVSQQNAKVNSHGIWMEDCAAAAPWIFDNFSIQAAGSAPTSNVDAVRIMGDCHAVIDSNRSIVGGGEDQAANPNAVHCGALNNVASQCVVLGNKSIEGSHFGFPPTATGVRCDGDGCARIAYNKITGRGGLNASYGVWLENTTAVVDSNTITGGCSPVAIGVHADNAAARVVNNLIFGFTGGDCTGMALPAVTASKGAEILVSSGLNEIDVHSNDIDGGGTPNGTCTSTGIQLGASAVPPISGVGVFRNNIVRGGACAAARFVFAEADTSADPRIFENNDLDTFQNPTALYVNENATNFTSAATVNMLADMTVSGVFSIDPSFANYPVDTHLLAGSMCIGAGTSAGAPAIDFEGTVRDPAKPDVGRDEF
ncbi:MAG: hypothetical protein U0414_21360 [Polyangiaceae bacterium]